MKANFVPQRDKSKVFSLAFKGFFPCSLSILGGIPITFLGLVLWQQFRAEKKTLCDQQCAFLFDQQLVNTIMLIFSFSQNFSVHHMFWPLRPLPVCGMHRISGCRDLHAQRALALLRGKLEKGELFVKNFSPCFSVFFSGSFYLFVRCVDPFLALRLLLLAPRVFVLWRTSRATNGPECVFPRE